MKKFFLALLLVAGIAHAQLPFINGLPWIQGGYFSNTITLLPGANFIGPMLIDNGSAGAPSYSFTNAPTDGFFDLADSNLRVAVAGVDQFRFTTDGQLVGSAGGAKLQFGTSGQILLQASGTNQSISLAPSGTGTNNISGGIVMPSTTTTAGGITIGDETVYRTGAQTIVWTGAGGNALAIDTANTRILVNFINALSGGTTFHQAHAAPQVDLAVNLGDSTHRWGTLFSPTIDSGSSNLTIVKSISSYNGLATAGNGIVTVQGAGSVTGQTGASAAITTYTVGASDADFEVSGNVLVTASTTHNFALQCSYTDEGNTARLVTMNVQQLGGTLVTAITNVTGLGPYEGLSLHIRAKASTAITILTSAAGTYTSVTYNARGAIRKLQ